MTNYPYIDHHDNDDHYFHQDAKYIEPDYYANDANRNVPIMSTIGRGPEGDGIEAEIIASSPDTFIYRLFNNVTGETVFQSPNLSGGTITVSQTDANPEDGEFNHAVFTVSHGGVKKSYDVTIPPGSAGARIYTIEGIVLRTKQDQYQWSVGSLMFDNHKTWPSKPKPRPYDIVMFSCHDDAKAYLAVGVVRAVENNQVVVTVQTYVELITPHIGDNGNWFVGEFDTGVKAQGAAGKEAKMRMGTVETVNPNIPASAEVTLIDEEDNLYELSLRIPEGRVGRSIDIQAGIFTEATLPVFHLTPINTAYIVNDGDGRYDLYVRGATAINPTLWTIVENWEGKPATIGDVSVVTLNQGETAYAEVAWTTTPEANQYDIKLFLPTRIAPGSIITEFLADEAVTYEKVDQRIKDGVDYRYTLPKAAIDAIGGVRLAPFSMGEDHKIYETEAGVGTMTFAGETIKHGKAILEDPANVGDPDTYEVTLSKNEHLLEGDENALAIVQVQFHQHNASNEIVLNFRAADGSAVILDVPLGRQKTAGSYDIGIWNPSDIAHDSAHYVAVFVDEVNNTHAAIVLDMPLPAGGKDFANIIDGEMVEIASKTKTGVVRTKEGGDINIDVQGVMSLAEGSVHTEHLASGAVTTEKIADKGVTLSKLGDDVLARIDINDDVLEFANLAAFPATGETGKIYIATDTNKMYRWSGAGYAEISSSLVSATGCANALIGTESGDGVYVDDAWPANAVRMVISGKSVQDGTPTPGTPVPIINVASPVQIMIPDNISG